MIVISISTNYSHYYRGFPFLSTLHRLIHWPPIRPQTKPKKELRFDSEQAMSIIIGIGRGRVTSVHALGPWTEPRGCFR